jgi:signal transduction histidine kinase
MILLAYLFIFYELLRENVPLNDAVVNVLFGILDLSAAAFGLIVVAVRLWSRHRRVVMLIVLGLCAMAATDFAYLGSLLAGGYLATDAFNSLYVLAFCFVYLAAFEQDQIDSPEPDEDPMRDLEERAARFETLLPPITVVLVILMAYLLRDRITSSQFPYMASAAMLFVASLALRNWWGYRVETQARSQAMASEAELQIANRELWDEMKVRARVQEELRQSQKMDALGQLTGGVAHDFNNLLSIILGNVELARRKVHDGEDIDRNLDQAARAANRGAAMTQHLLALSREQALSPQTIRIGDLLSSMRNLLGVTMGGHISLDIVHHEDIGLCTADPGQLETALLNLAINARDAMSEGGMLTVEFESVELDEDDVMSNPGARPGHFIAVSVRDTGTGISPEVLSRVFDPFYTTKGQGEGTGLGLSMVYGFAKQSGGLVTIESEEGVGTLVRLYLPQAEEEIGEQAEDEVGEVPRGRGESVLVVEDEPAVRELVVSLLEELDYEVDGAGDGAEALAVLAATEHVDLLLSDVVLPGGMSGVQLSREVKQRRPEVRILLMSGYAAGTLKKEGRLDPGVELLPKPFQQIELASKVREVLDEDA